MLALPKKTDYALIALGYLLERPGRVAPAREIAEAYHLPCALLMNVMKELQQGGMVKSLRGAKGGYQISVDPAKASLYEVVVLTSGEPALTECCGGRSVSDGLPNTEPGDSMSGTEGMGTCAVAHNCPIRLPLRGLHERLVRFLKDVKLSDLLLKGTRIDVPSDQVGVTTATAAV